MTLARYRRKRDFRLTREPRGGQTAKKGRLFVVQKHAARQLHYDVRLQIGDVLASWAVPKGPSLDPDVKRLAMHVEDHPLEYGSFEGTIPAGEYGAGTVMLWDHGTWDIDGDPQTEYRQGKLHFTLHGEKLRGEWVLVRRGGRTGETDRGDPWFFFKIRDAEARPGDDDGILEREPDSVTSGRTLDEIAAGKKPRGRSRRRNTKAAAANPAAPPRPAAARRDPQALKQLLAELSDARKGPLPATVRPQLATLAKRAPAGDQWLNEIKFDGYRMICRVERRKVTFSSRNQLDWTARLSHLVNAVRGLGVASAIFDGELVALEPDGTTSFQGLQNAMAEKRIGQLVYYVFDLLYLDGRNLTRVPLENRKRLLAALASDARGPLRYSEHTAGGAPELFAQAVKMRLEGIICKRRDRPHRPGRSTEWLKVKCSHREEFVIGGYTPPSGSRIGFGALVVGYYDNQHNLVYAGRVGTGFDDRLLAQLARRLSSLEQKDSPFVNLKGRTGAARGVHWVKPQLVAQVAFSQWTRDGYLRQPSFQGLRDDKPAAEVVLEQPISPSTVEMKSTSAKKTKRKSADPSDDAPLSAIPERVRLTHPDKLLYPDEEITKRQLAGYYAHVADWILPHVAGRPLVLVRCPNGYTGQCFYQKQTGKGMPDALARVAIKDKTKKIEYAVVDGVEALLSLVQMNTLEIHAWGARADNPERPDRLVFDLDPGEGVPWNRVAESAVQLRSFLSELGLAAFLKTTGGKGLHLVLPIERRTSWDDAHEICQAIAAAAAQSDPGRYTITLSKSARAGKIFIDYLRNARGATAIAPYSTRARPGCPVATPISWEELPKIQSANQFTLANVFARLAALQRDPWHEMDDARQSLSKSLLKKHHIHV
jgi:bifunctional non-homologous end joining protein LigD